jgi:hypothetical protein
VNGYYSPNPQVVITELTYNGSIEGPNVTADGRLGLGVSNPVQALEVAGNMVVNGTVSHQSTTFRNVLYNGDMRINQRGISTNWASPSTTIGYTVDRWYALKAAGLAYAQLTTGTSDLPFVNDGIVYYIRTGRTAADTNASQVYLGQALETRDSYRLCGKSVTLSMYYRTGSTFSGGTVLCSIIWGTGTDNSPLAFTGTVYQNFTLQATTSWTKTSFSAQIPVSATQVGLIYQYGTSSSASSNDYFDVTGVQLEKGTIATPYEIRPYGVELQLCQRYYQKSYSNVVAPGTNTQVGMTVATRWADSTGTNFLAVRLTPTMRAPPTTVTYYRPVGTSGSWNDESGTARSCATQNAGDGCFTVVMSGSSANSTGQMYGQWTADAEL